MHFVKRSRGCIGIDGKEVKSKTDAEIVEGLSQDQRRTKRLELANVDMHFIKEVAIRRKHPLKSLYLHNIMLKGYPEEFPEVFDLFGKVTDSVGINQCLFLNTKLIHSLSLQLTTITINYSKVNSADFELLAKLLLSK